MISHMGPKPLSGLHELAALLATKSPLNGRLDDLVRCAARAMNAGACSILLLIEDDGGLPHPEPYCSTEVFATPARREAQIPETELARDVIKRGRAILIPDGAGSAPAKGKRRATTRIGIPITVDDDPIGVMILTKPLGAAGFDKNDLELAGIAATMIGKSIQVDRLQTLLRSRVAQLTLVREEKNVAERLTGGMLPPSRLAKLLAKSFYKDLADAGFEPGQIVEAASEIIDQITTDVTRFGKRLARQGVTTR